MRCHIAALGMIHKRVLGERHPMFETLLPWYVDHFDTSRAIGHSKQLYGHWLGAPQHGALH